MAQNTNESNTTARRTGALLIALALIVGVDIGARFGAVPASRAYAQTGAAGLANPADQRREIIAELRKINASIAKLRETVNSGLNSGPVDVSVVDFPKNLLASE